MTEKKGSKKVLLIVLLIIGLVAVVYFYNSYPKQGKIDINPTSGTVTGNGGAGISVSLYDAQGNLIQTAQSFSVVNNVPGVAFIGLTLSATSTSTSPNLACTPTLITPGLYNTALIDKTQKNIASGGIASWTSGLINTTTLENIGTPTVFNATITCSYSLGGNTYNPTFKGGTIINITQDTSNQSAQVQVSVSQSGGAPTLWCGDTICSPENNETTLTCSADCAPAQLNAKFRTTATDYTSGSAIGYTASCGSTLTQLGYRSSSGSIAGNCTTIASFTCNAVTVNKVFAVPGVYSGRSVETYLFTNGNTGCICRTISSTQYNYVGYDTTHGNPSLVNNSSIFTDANTEVVCP